MYECRHPDTPCFTTHCRIKPQALWSRSFKYYKQHQMSDDVFVGGSEWIYFIVFRMARYNNTNNNIIFCNIYYWKYFLDVESPPSQSVSAFSDQSADKSSTKQSNDDVSIKHCFRIKIMIIMICIISRTFGYRRQRTLFFQKQSPRRALVPRMST